jgi:hypothetical protein
MGRGTESQEPVVNPGMQSGHAGKGLCGRRHVDSTKLHGLGCHCAHTASFEVGAAVAAMRNKKQQQNSRAEGQEPFTHHWLGAAAGRDRPLRRPGNVSEDGPRGEVAWSCEAKQTQRKRTQVSEVALGGARWEGAGERRWAAVGWRSARFRPPVSRWLPRPWPSSRGPGRSCWGRCPAWAPAAAAGVPAPGAIAAPALLCFRCGFPISTVSRLKRLQGAHTHIGSSLAGRGTARSGQEGANAVESCNF